MSFHEDLIPLFKRDLAAVLAVVPDAIYVGDQPQKITRQGLEVWVEPGAGGVAQVGALKVHPYVLHVRLKTRRGAKGPPRGTSLAARSGCCRC